MRLRALAICGCLAAATAHGATFTVTSLSDSGPGSLRQAVTDANNAAGADTITFSVTGTITLTTGLMLVTDALTIQGPGPTALIVDGNANNRIFAIVEFPAPACPALTGPSDFPVVISGMTLRNGQRNVADSVGGAIYAAKSLTVDNVTFENNRARAGGAVWFSTQYVGQALTVTNSRFTGNQAREIVAPTASTHAGGAIGSAANCSTPTQSVTMTIADSVFTGNSAVAGTVNARGGAIFFNTSDADVTITRTTISNNLALPPIVPNGNVNAQGGGISGSAMDLTIRDSTISGNEAQRSAAMHLFNDALARQTFHERMIVEVINSTISGNRADETSIVFVYANVDLRLRNTTLVRNVSAQNRTSGVNMVTGPTVPASASNAIAPTLALESSVLWNPDGVRDIGKDFATMPGALAVPSNNSIVGRLCDSACGPGAMTLSGTGNQVGVDPLLGPLASNGGPTQTRLPQLGSPAIATGNNAQALTTDQRGTGFPRTIGVLTDAGATEYFYPAQCVNFGDILGDSVFCPSAAWMKWQNVTTGCGNGTIYCPGDDVIRLSMAAFMQRFGLPLSGFGYMKSETSGPLDFATAPVICMSDPIPASAAQRRAVLDAVFAGVAGADSLGRANFMYSEDNGATWIVSPQLFTMRTTFKTGLWRSLRIAGHLDVEANKTLRFGIRMDRPDTNPASVTDSTCRLRVRMQNSTGFTPL